jgi:hemerythrin-like domain-containing protein
MQPIGPLMREHRLIERMVGLLEAELAEIGKVNKASPGFIKTAIDFFRTYANRTHHGKEEEILFKGLAAKPISAEHRSLMNELLAEHEISRRTIGSLESDIRSYEKGSDTLAEIKSHLETLVKLYPRHIEKEDKHFFYPAMEYFSREECNKMLQEFWDFDRGLIHEKYQAVVEGLKKEREKPE